MSDVAKPLMPTLVQWLGDTLDGRAGLPWWCPASCSPPEVAPTGLPVKLSPLPVLLQRTRLVVAPPAALLLAAGAVGSPGWLPWRSNCARRYLASALTAASG